MTITYDLDLNSFNAWSGAVDTLDRIQREGKCEELENILEDLYPDGSSMICYGSILNRCMNGLELEVKNKLEKKSRRQKMNLLIYKAI